ncbi:TIM barrel protein [Paracoccus sp. 1_MG-2023]|uniref:hydroxypyruvate isomerase family protein n=2 Tax=unclassified Paracoccus (in: a-proteobacteria) TaxID=2688777 RepID=UPI001C0850D6|nr:MULTISPECIES: TIM barrel protein [unclassified Paracoccus (in: a-proteobacteria)]MBU2958838.1 TIM barrel protein [Paracoccus sp. C2R09]MDO6670031.1 TIM barrel protein [Paracoccus sp. 1_MG-2023]
MPRFAANLTMLFTELPLTERFAAAAEAGFAGVEILFPYDTATPELKRACKAAGLDFVLINAPPPNWAGGARGFAAIPGLQERFQRDFERSLRVAQVLGARHIHLMAGKAQGDEAMETYVANLAWAAKRAPHASLTIEPLNATDRPGYFLDGFDMAVEVIDRVGAPNLGLQFDTYHAQSITGDALATWARVKSHVRHVQVAAHPGRSEPDGGDLDHSEFFAALDEDGYRGWVGAEYIPLRTTHVGLAWLQHALRKGTLPA